MEISKNLEILDLALWLKKEQTLLISDLHLGYEETLQQQGILLPKSQGKEIIQRLKTIFQKIKPKTIIINGDIKHEFGRVLKQEWSEVLQLVDFLLEHCSQLILIRGNHDMILGPIAAKRNIQIVDSYQIDNTFITHGDKIIQTKAERIIIGHEHPAVCLRENSKVEKYKCFLKGKWQRKELIVLPSFNSLLEGTDILKETLLSPYLDDLSKFEIFIVGKEEVYDFGKVKDVVRL